MTIRVLLAKGREYASFTVDSYEVNASGTLILNLFTGVTKKLRYNQYVWFKVI